MSTEDNLTKFERAVRWTTRKNGPWSTYKTTGSHDWLLKLGINCFKNELSQDAAINMAVHMAGDTYTGTSGTGKTELVVKKGWEWASKR